MVGRCTDVAVLWGSGHQPDQVGLVSALGQPLPQHMDNALRATEFVDVVRDDYHAGLSHDSNLRRPEVSALGR